MQLIPLKTTLMGDSIAAITKPMSNGGWVGGSGIKNPKKLKRNIPSWVKEGFEELVSKQKLRPEEAISKLRLSPFFDEKWIKG